jgi:hypothetical protein
MAFFATIQTVPLPQNPASLLQHEMLADVAVGSSAEMLRTFK